MPNGDQAADFNGTTEYTPAPPGGRHTYIPPKPSCTRWRATLTKAYDVAVENPQIVAQMQTKIAEMLLGFPEPVQKAWVEAQSRKTNLNMPTGSYPTPAKQ